MTNTPLTDDKIRNFWNEVINDEELEKRKKVVFLDDVLSAKRLLFIKIHNKTKGAIPLFGYEIDRLIHECFPLTDDKEKERHDNE